MKGAGFTYSSILFAMQDESKQQSFAETRAQAIAGEAISSLPELGAGRVLVVVEAEERAEDALNIINRNHAVTGGVRIPAE